MTVTCPTVFCFSKILQSAPNWPKSEHSASSSHWMDVLKFDGNQAQLRCYSENNRTHVRTWLCVLQSKIYSQSLLPRWVCAPVTYRWTDQPEGFSSDKHSVWPIKVISRPGTSAVWVFHWPRKPMSSFILQSDIDPKSKLMDQAFVGEMLLSVNDENVTNLDSLDVSRLIMARSKEIRKLNMLRSYCVQQIVYFYFTLRSECHK